MFDGFGEGSVVVIIAVYVLKGPSTPHTPSRKKINQICKMSRKTNKEPMKWNMPVHSPKNEFPGINVNNCMMKFQHTWQMQ